MEVDIEQLAQDSLSIEPDPRPVVGAATGREARLVRTGARLDPAGRRRWPHALREREALQGVMLSP
jgi:hypothetical protein